MRAAISVFIITKNEEDRLPFAIKSVREWVDEVIVIDSGSSDNTVKIATDLGADLVVYHEWKGYGPQKVFGESKCKHNILFNIDADEEVSPALRDEIIALVDHGLKQSAYRIPIKTFSRFLNCVPKFAPSNNVLRLYDRRKAGFADSNIHDAVIIRNGEEGQLKGHMIHRCFRSYEHAIAKINMYSSMQAIDLYNKGRKPKAIRIVFEPFYSFLKAYLQDRYIFLGLEGLIEAFIYAFARTLRLVKAWEMFMRNGK